MLPDLLKRLLYATGALGIYHRWRNRRTLSVLMLHRVLDPADPRWPGCDPDYTLSTHHLGQCLRFLTRHYNIVNIAAVQQARRGGHKLPARALLITFDDGWADNAEHALPLLQGLALPGLMFVVADAVGRQEAFFQERLLSAWRRGRLSTGQLAAALRHAGGAAEPATQALPETAHDFASPQAVRRLRHLIAGAEQLPEPARLALLDALAPQLADAERHMVTADELALLASAGVAIGAHGKTHQPLTRAADLDAELRGARSALAACMPTAPPPTTMSFPHGQFDAAVVAQAHAAGFDLLFSSKPVINSTRNGVAACLGRLGVETATLADAHGRFRPERLALGLFRRPHQPLT